MKYSVTCDCGQILPVEATQAGSTLQCRCERTVQVPRLSALRVAAGETAIPLNAAERVRQGVRDGTLPNNPLCPLTARVPDAIAVFRVRCEKVWRRRTDDDSFSTWQAIFWGMVLGPAGIMLSVLRGMVRSRWRAGGVEELGRDTFVEAPVRVAAEVLPQLARQRNQRRLRDILTPTPQYADLFAEYPDAEIKFHSGTR